MERLQYLWLQYTGKKASDQELEELFSLIADPENVLLLRQVVEGLGNSEQPLQNYDPVQWDWLVATALGRSTEPVTVLPVKTTVPFLRRWTWAAAAAVVLLCIGIFFETKHNTTKQQNIVSNSKADILPGTNKAILTLANGSKIILDSAHNGILALQSGSQIIKTDSGKLTYKTSKENQFVVSFNTLTTPRGGQFQLALPDGTRVWLNAASSITYPTAFAGSDRNVTITGEVYFEVAHDKLKPFHVKVNDMEVAVLGTHFNINAYADRPSVNTTLLEGSVKITRKKQTEFLKPGQQAVVTENIKVSDDIDLEQVMAWKNGEISLTNTNVQQIMMDISRWYDVDVKYAGAVPNKKFFGSIDRNVPLSTVLRGLKSYGVETTLEGKTIIVQ